MGGPVLAPLGPLRARHGGDALLAYRRGLRGRITEHTPEVYVARLYASCIVEADDEFCRGELGLVVSSDRIRRADLAALVEAGRPDRDCGHRAPMLGCMACARATAWDRIADRLRGSRRPGAR